MKQNLVTIKQAVALQRLGYGKRNQEAIIPKNSFNIYAAKRNAIQIAIRYIEKEQKAIKTKNNDSKKGKN